MNAVMDHSVILKDVRGALSADTLEDSGGDDFVIGEEGLWLRSGPRTMAPKLVGRRAGHGGTKESDVVRITL